MGGGLYCGVPRGAVSLAINLADACIPTSMASCTNYIRARAPREGNLGETWRIIMEEVVQKVFPLAAAVARPPPQFASTYYTPATFTSLSYSFLNSRTCLFPFPRAAPAATAIAAAAASLRGPHFAISLFHSRCERRKFEFITSASPKPNQDNAVAAAKRKRQAKGGQTCMLCDRFELFDIYLRIVTVDTVNMKNFKYKFHIKNAKNSNKIFNCEQFSMPSQFDCCIGKMTIRQI